MRWFVYLLECSNGSLYTGIARNVEQRFAQHVRGQGARYTRSFPPQRIAHVIACDTRSQALRLEYSIKQLNTAAKRQLCLSGERPDLLPEKPAQEADAAAPSA